MPFGSAENVKRKITFKKYYKYEKHITLHSITNCIADIEAYDLKIQDATFDNSSILKAKLYINGTIQGKSNGFFELRYKGNAISRIDPSPMVKIIKEEKE